MSAAPPIPAGAMMGPRDGRHAPGPMTGKFVGYFRLLDACARPGCPVCRCLRDDSLRHLRTLLYEHVTDPGVRAALRAARGFCNWHAAMLLDLPDAGFGAAILSADLLAAERSRAARLAGPRGRGSSRLASLRGLFGAGPGAPADGRGSRRRCPTCEAVGASEGRYLREMLAFVGDPEFDAAFAQADGLCRPHLARLPEHAERPAHAAALARLVELNRAKWRRLEGALQRFVDKHEPRKRAPLTEEEAGAWRLALELLAGAPGVFGNEMLARPAPRRSRRPGGGE